jgi:uncharacterized membrane protein
MEVKKVAGTGIFAALIFAITFLVRIPVPFLPGGYLNPGDVVIYIAAMLLGGPLGFFAAAAGSTLADLLAGAAIYAPATFVIKGVMAFVVGHFARVARVKGDEGKSFGRYVAAVAAASLIMVAGYFAFEAILFAAKDGTPYYAILSVPFNLIQGGGSFVLALIAYKPIRRLQARN